MDVQLATQTHSCLFPNCTNEAKSSRGAYAYCDAHRGKVSTPHPRSGTAPPQPARRNGAGEELTTEQKVRSLAAAARDVDKAFTKATRLGREAVEAQRDAENLKRAFERQAAELIGAR